MLNDITSTAITKAMLSFFNFLKEHPSDFNSIHSSLNIKKRPLDVMLTLFKSYGFIEEKDEKFYLSDISDDYLTSESSFDLSSYISSLRERPICDEILFNKREIDIDNLKIFH